MKINRRLLYATLGALLLVLPFPYILTTQSGLNLLFRVTMQLIPGQLSLEKLEGSVNSTISFSRLIYKNESLEVKLQQGSLLWQPIKLLEGVLHIDQLKIDGIAINTLQTEQNKQNELPSIILPIRLNIVNTQLNQILLSSDNEPSLDLNSLSFAMSSHNNTLDISWFVAKAKDWDLNLQGKVTPQKSYPVELKLTFKQNELFAQAFLVDANLKGDLQRLHTTADVQGFVNGNINGYLLNIHQELRWNARANVRKLSLSSFADDLPDNNITGKFQSVGTLNKIKFKGDAFTEYDELGELVAGYELLLAGSELTITEFNLQEKKLPTLLQGKGKINWAGDEVDYNLNARWQKIFWPLHQPYQIKSERGNVEFKGTLSSFRLVTDGDIDLPNYPAIQFTSTAQGDLEHLVFDNVTMQAVQGEISGNGALHWKEGVSWQAKLNAEQINPGVIWGDWPGKINGNISSTGKIINDNFNAQLSLTDIAGHLREKKLSGTADVKIHNANMTFQSVVLNIDKTNLSISGEITDQINMTYSLNSNDLGTLLPKAKGSLYSQGVIKGPRKKPHIKVELNGENLGYENYSLVKVHTEVDVSLRPEDRSVITLKADGFQFDEFLVDQLALGIDGSTANHRVDIDLLQGDNKAIWRLLGGLDNNNWQGQITESMFESKPLGQWKIEQQSKISIAKDKVVADKLCYLQQQAYFCLQAQYQEKDPKIKINTTWQKLPSQLLATWLPETIRVNTLFNGQAQIKFHKSELLINADVLNTQGDITILQDEAEYSIPFREGKAGLIWNSENINLSMQLPLENEAFIEAQVLIDQKKNDLSLVQKPLTGKLKLKTSSLIVLAPFIPDIKDLEKASANAQLKFTGSLAKPMVVGHVQIHSPELTVPQLNVTLKNLKINADSNANGLIKYYAIGESGEGKLEASGEIQMQGMDIMQGHAILKGENFTMVDLPEATVNISPKLIAQFQKQQAAIEGDILIPYARLRPKTLPQDTFTESTDVIIVGEAVEPEETRRPWQIDTKIRVVLGDKVSFDGFGLRSRLMGSVQIVDKPGTVIIGRGEINLEEGFYRTFGQELQINKGRFIFANTPIDDPGIDIQAQRKIGEIVTGVNVTSTLRKPEVRLFSTPSMSETDILSYLLLGRPFKQVNQGEGDQLMTAAQAMGLAGSELLARSIGNRLGIDEVMVETSSDTGNSSLVIGRYLSPRLYIRYLTGIFERSNIVQLRYDVSKKVMIQTETGSQMGADVFYSIER